MFKFLLSWCFVIIFALSLTAQSKTSSTSKSSSSTSKSSSSSNNENTEDLKGQEAKSEIIEGTLKSSALIDIENDVDYLESKYSDVIRSERNSVLDKDYDSRITSFRANCKKLQDEISKNNPQNKTINFNKYPEAINKALSSSHLVYKDADGWFYARLGSTRRNNRYNQNFSSCNTEYIFDKEKAAVSRVPECSKNHYMKIKSKIDRLKNDLISMRETVNEMRANIVELEKTGLWNTLKRNGRICKANYYY